MSVQRLDDWRVFRTAEKVADRFYEIIQAWEPFERNGVGSQLTRAVDSIGANIAESYGRFHYGDKLNFLYFARGSVFETQYWVRRAMVRGLLTNDIGSKAVTVLAQLAAQLNVMINQLRRMRTNAPLDTKPVREVVETYRNGADHSEQEFAFAYGVDDSPAMPVVEESNDLF